MWVSKKIRWKNSVFDLRQQESELATKYKPQGSWIFLLPHTYPDIVQVSLWRRNLQATHLMEGATHVQGVNKNASAAESLSKQA